VTEPKYFPIVQCFVWGMINILIVEAEHEIVINSALTFSNDTPGRNRVITVSHLASLRTEASREQLCSLVGL
jgi:hypothetical protein